MVSQIFNPAETYKPHNINVFLIIFCLIQIIFGFKLFAQNVPTIRGNDDADISMLNITTANQLDRGSNFIGSSFIKGAVNVSDYSGNLTISHAMDINFPGALKTKLTLTFNSNTSFAYFEDYVSSLCSNPMLGYMGDLNSDAIGVRENSVNAACWIFGVNGIAVQTTNFEKNFFLGSVDNPEQESKDSLCGTQVPLLATGYNYTNDINCPWDIPERTRLLNNIGINPDLIPAGHMDFIKIMNSEGSVIMLRNPVFRSDNDISQVDTIDCNLKGLYFDADEKSNGYAIVNWKDSTNGLFGERNIYYKPGDGLTYYFEEEYVSYQNYGSPTDWGARYTNPPKIAYLKRIEAPNGDSIAFSYDYNNIFGVNVTNGRKFLKKIEYYNNGAPLTDGYITFDYVKDDSNNFKIIIVNNLSGESYTIKLMDNSHFAQAAGFNTLVRDSSLSSSSIMQVDYIQNNNNLNKKVSFTYDNFIRKYTYGGVFGDEFDNDNGGPLSVKNYYFLEFPTKLMTARIILNGEKNDFTYWTDTELDGSTSMYNADSSYNFREAYELPSSNGMTSSPPWEFTNHWGYFINAYQNSPNQWWYDYRSSSWSSIYKWYRYFLPYNYNNMYHAMRDNYTALMIKKIDNSIWDGSQFKPVSKKEYKYSWEHTLLAGIDENYPQYYDGTQVIRQVPEYDDLSPRITNIITEITSTNQDTASQYASDSSYIEKKYYEQLKVSSKFIPPSYGQYSAYFSPNVATELRMTQDSIFNENGDPIQSTVYNYKENMPIRIHQINGYAFLRYYHISDPSDLSLISKSVSFDGITKATVYNSDVFDKFNYYHDPNIYRIYADSCQIRNSSANTNTIVETYRTSSQSHNVKTVKQFNNDFAIDATTNYPDISYIYKPDLPKETDVYGQIGSGNWERKSRESSIYYSLTDPVGKRTNLKQEIYYGNNDNDSTKTTYDYYTTSPNIGFLKTTFDGKSTTTYQYNNQVGNTATGIVVPVGISQYNYNQRWSSFQPEPFKTTKTFTSQYGSQMNYTTYTGYDGIGNLRFSVDENGYYSSSFYDSIGRITKSYIPGTYYSNITSPLSTELASSTLYGNAGYSYNDNLWTPAITKYSYGGSNGANPVTTKSYFLPSELAYVNSVIDGSEVMKSKEKYNYLGKKIYSEDGDNNKVYYLYDKYLNLAQTRFISNSPSSPTKKDSVEYNNDPTYFKRIKLTDENGNYQYNYYDLYGNVIKNVKYLSPSSTLTTNFTYDNLNRLSSVTSPGGKVTSYQYDDKGNLSQKTTPDAGTTKYKYDKYGNLRYIQDSNHPSTINNVSKSGNVNSQPINGTFALSGKGRVDFGITVSNIPSGCAIKIDIKTTGDIVIKSVSATPSNPTFSSSVYLPKGSYHYTVQATGTAGGYYTIGCTSNLAFVYNKYDNLNRIIETGEYYSNSSNAFANADSSDASFPPSANCLINKKYFYDSSSTDPDASGQRNLTGKLSYVEKYTDGNITYSGFYSYDDLGRVEWLVEKHLGWYVKKLSYQYDLQGNLTLKDLVDNDWRNNNFYTLYSYDNSGRMSTVQTKHDPDSYVQEAHYTYYPSDRVKRLQLANAQGVDYRYNSRGWLTSINNADPDGSDPGNDGNNTHTDRFAENIGYNNIVDGIGKHQGVAANYNGNISWLIYNMNGVAYPLNTDIYGYTFTYDNANRLKKADFGYEYYDNFAEYYLWATTDDYDAQYSYLNDGNFNTLQRNGSSGSVQDSLNYNYINNTNKLSSITGTTTVNYTYDSNGNITSDPHNGIAFIIYDSDNLPVHVYKTDGEQLLYTYDMNGNRVRNTVVGGSADQDHHYFRDYDGSTEAVCLYPYSSNLTYNILGAGGDNIGQVKVVNNSVTGRYYYLKDHLGSIRVTVDANGNRVGWNDYYPYGMLMSGRTGTNSEDHRYKFTGKERDDETGLDYFGARYYDSWQGRWLQVDPLAEKYPGWSPYNYSIDDPLRFIDPDGKGFKEFWAKLKTAVKYEISVGARIDFKTTVFGKGAKVGLNVASYTVLSGNLSSKPKLMSGEMTSGASVKLMGLGASAEKTVSPVVTKTTHHGIFTDITSSNTLTEKSSFNLGSGNVNHEVVTQATSTDFGPVEKKVIENTYNIGITPDLKIGAHFILGGSLDVNIKKTINAVRALFQ